MFMRLGVDCVASEEIVYNVEIKEIKGWVVKEEVSKPHYLLNYLLGRVMNILEKLCLYM